MSILSQLGISTHIMLICAKGNWDRVAQKHRAILVVKGQKTTVVKKFVFQYYLYHKQKGSIFYKNIWITKQYKVSEMEERKCSCQEKENQFLMIVPSESTSMHESTKGQGLHCQISSNFSQRASSSQPVNKETSYLTYHPYIGQKQ